MYQITGKRSWWAMAMRTKTARLLSSITHKPTLQNTTSINENLSLFKNQPGPFSGSGSFSSSAPNSEVMNSSRLVGWKGYEEYRRALYGGNITHKALLVDAVGTLVIPSQPMAQVSFFNFFWKKNPFFFIFMIISFVIIYFCWLYVLLDI